ncbi:RapZ C-terminal domain-containing protein [Thermomonospora umbrina]|uniref:RapZ C-terminal domain-containing protein n=1 Tax=Thermomonospora umbrina TaxID=111806 RepID=UPI000E23BE2A|nr:RNase adapter RapZ [Thermomonospora umbrina]
MEHRNVPAVRIVSFGYLHGDPPPAHVTLDLRVHFRDPHISPKLRYMTAEDFDVRDAVRRTPGIWALIESTCDLANAYLAGPGSAVLTIAVGCSGGRHRAPTVAGSLAESLRRDHDVEHQDRDLSKDVVER